MLEHKVDTASRFPVTSEFINQLPRPNDGLRESLVELTRASHETIELLIKIDARLKAIESKTRGHRGEN
jgi:hypothetical protein